MPEVIVNKKTLEKIKRIIEKNYNYMLLTTMGNTVFTDDELDELRAQGLDISNEESLLSMVYHNNILNDLVDSKGPTNISQMRAQQGNTKATNFHKAAEEHLNENYRHLVDKHKADVLSRIEGIIRNANNDFRSDELNNRRRAEIVSQLTRESSVGKLKQSLRDLSGDFNRNFERIAVTETANAIGMGSVDRVLDDNEDKSAEEIYVYRIPVNDGALCKHCRKFYLDEDQTPAVYRLATLLSNGSNYGKKTADWNAVAGATHPNDRESGVLELKPGWKVGPGGSLEYIGEDNWREYLESKLRS